MGKTYKVPNIVWIKMTDYMHPWLQHELGCGARIQDQKVVCVQHLPGARDILRMEVWEDLMDKMPVGNAMSGTRKNCYCAGLDIDPSVMEREYGVTKELMDLFVPIECPKMCLTKYGVLRPWTLDMCMSKPQASAMQRLLRAEFWNAVDAFNERYAAEMDGEYYPAREMIEEFCRETETPDLYAEAIRREWQRRVKRGNG
ncbi:MAG: hypothetical protein PUC18_12570 [Prevotellaceae bacterium]|nr:hypothetical protein [Prevotellaceae bacterium]